MQKIGFLKESKESPNDAIQILPNVSYSTLVNEQQQVFLQVMAYFKKIKQEGDKNTIPPLQINVDGTARTGKSYLIWAISHELRKLYADEKISNKDPIVQLAPTGVSAFGIQGWTVNFGLSIPVKEGKEFQPLKNNCLQRLQT